MAIASQIITWTALYASTVSVCICLICLCTTNQILKTLPKIIPKESNSPKILFENEMIDSNIQAEQNTKEKVIEDDIATIAEQKLKNNLKKIHELTTS